MSGLSGGMEQIVECRKFEAIKENTLVISFENMEILNLNDIFSRDGKLADSYKTYLNYIC